MGRPCKAIDSQSRHNTKVEIEARKEQEKRLKALSDKIDKPPSDLSGEQKKIYKFIIDELKLTGILTNLDIFILTKCAIAIDRLGNIEKKINSNPRLMFNKDIKSTKETYDKDFYRCCNELSLSPQSRAKLANINLQVQQEKEDPLLKALREDDEE